eukprot:m.1234134 g.1234134  ORF g.1234134 m.1234134 type:complete len:590 (+) comp24664_c0_seq10:540-2309(+)
MSVARRVRVKHSHDQYSPQAHASSTPSDMMVGGVIGGFPGIGMHPIDTMPAYNVGTEGILNGMESFPIGTDPSLAPPFWTPVGSVPHVSHASMMRMPYTNGMSRQQSEASPRSRKEKKRAASSSIDFSRDAQSPDTVPPMASFADVSEVPTWKENEYETCSKLLGHDMTEVFIETDLTIDKGFRFSTFDNSFVGQKKNHFQITFQIGLSNHPRYVVTSTGVMRIEGMTLNLYGIKSEQPQSRVGLEQSQTDRTKHPLYPIDIKIHPEGSNTYSGSVLRLHFKEPTGNNMRRRGLPNPDQKYFHLVATLHAFDAEGFKYSVASYSTEKLIIRASNPRQFVRDGNSSGGATPSSSPTRASPHSRNSISQRSPTRGRQFEHNDYHDDSDDMLDSSSSPPSSSPGDLPVHRLPSAVGSTSGWRTDQQGVAYDGHVSIKNTAASESLRVHGDVMVHGSIACIPADYSTPNRKKRITDTQKCLDRVLATRLECHNSHPVTNSKQRVHPVPNIALRGGTGTSASTPVDVSTLLLDCAGAIQALNGTLAVTQSQLSLVRQEVADLRAQLQASTTEPDDIASTAPPICMLQDNLDIHS